jgi:hypothetical protein
MATATLTTMATATITAMATLAITAMGMATPAITREITAGVTSSTR